MGPWPARADGCTQTALETQQGPRGAQGPGGREELLGTGLVCNSFRLGPSRGVGARVPPLDMVSGRGLTRVSTLDMMSSSSLRAL